MRRLKARRDDGFTLIEVLVSIAMISVVTSGLTMFFVQSRASVQVQSQMEQASQMVAAAMERVSLLPGTSLVLGRPAWCVNDQWTAAPAAVRLYLNNLSQLPDVSLPAQTLTTAICTSSATLNAETLPTQQVNAVVVNGRSANFTQNSYIGTCWQQINSSTVTSGTCVKPVGTLTAAYQPMLRVVTAVSWPSAKCPANSCLYVSDSLVPLAIADITFQLP
jgi:prepilin-type N-terminal cleavage/methylation domain-containing protein